MKKVTLLIIFVLQLISLTNCTRYNYQRFVEYLKAEKQLRANTINEQELQDKIAALRKNYKIDPENEIAKLSDHGQLWVEFLMDLSRAR
ncbi:hypothetical protein A2Y85_04055 [candidate division WOR-3 bacterium RBG_13_43_14]|uniref:Uncharacterized protein n=1 Tax=candidate division WOR-3 bacterium RBG_13_43_14 TaxID=1802590 RepID=A0A1F4U9V6_UNCW3|nr:MAG: hypothetical protein A2Y85_04055 [candidate division WOR-3 bacterium RBG_13_43_14]